MPPKKRKQTAKAMEHVNALYQYDNLPEINAAINHNRAHVAGYTHLANRIAHPGDNFRTMMPGPHVLHGPSPEVWLALL